MGIEFRSKSDTEVLLLAWRQWGKDCLKLLTGMFAFAVLDRKESKIYCCRDPFGIKPFFYNFDSHKFSFASEICALLKLDSFRPKLNKLKALRYLVNNDYDHGIETFFQGYFRLEPGHCLTVNLGQQLTIHKERWWYPSIVEREDISFVEAADTIKKMFLENLRLHLRSDVPIGFALSGGIDSSSIVCGVRQIDHMLPIHTFTFVGDGEKRNEESWADLVNLNVKAVAHKIRITEDDLLNDIEDLVYCQGEPFPTTSIYAQYRVFRKAREEGIIVTLDGQGADEVFGGYNGYSSYRLQSFLDTVQSAFPDNQFEIRSPYGNSFLFIKDLAKNMVPTSIAKSFRSAFKSWGRNSWFRGQVNELLQILEETIPNQENGEKNRRLVARLRDELTDVSLQALLRYEDRNSMRWSLESRVPFLTTNLAEYCLGLPEHFLVSKVGQTKAVFRAAMRGIVPDIVLDRKDKVGFETPDFSWLRSLSKKMDPWIDSLAGCDFIFVEKYRKRVRDILANDRGNPWEAWRMICFARWYSIFFS